MPIKRCLKYAKQTDIAWHHTEILCRLPDNYENKSLKKIEIEKLSKLEPTSVSPVRR